MEKVLEEHCKPQFERWYFNTKKINLSMEEEEFIKSNRKRLLENATKEEIVVAHFLDQANVDFFPQMPIHIQEIHSTFWADFFIPKNQIVLEVDGSSHNRLSARTKDAYRDGFMKKRQYTVVRISNDDVNSGKYKELLADIIARCVKKEKKPNENVEQQIPNEKLLRKSLQFISDTIDSYDGTSVCFVALDRHIINLMTDNRKDEHPLYRDAMLILDKAKERGIDIYWKYGTKKAKDWMGRHLNNNVTKQYIKAVRSGAPDVYIRV